jgi:hypothetical protein
VTYDLAQIDGGTQLTLRQGPFGSPEALEGNAIGWQASFEALVGLLA